MRHFLALCMICGLAAVGCGKTSEVKEVKTVSTPEGETTTTQTTTVEQTGENPPAAPNP